MKSLKPLQKALVFFIFFGLQAEVWASSSPLTRPNPYKKIEKKNSSSSFSSGSPFAACFPRVSTPKEPGPLPQLTLILSWSPLVHIKKVGVKTDQELKKAHDHLLAQQDQIMRLPRNETTAKGRDDIEEKLREIVRKRKNSDGFIDHYDDMQKDGEDALSQEDDEDALSQEDDNDSQSEEDDSLFTIETNEGKYRITKAPGLNEFLKELAKRKKERNYRVVLYTTKDPELDFELLAELDPQRELFTEIYDKNRCASNTDGKLEKVLVSRDEIQESQFGKCCLVNWQRTMIVDTHFSVQQHKDNIFWLGEAFIPTSEESAVSFYQNEDGEMVSNNNTVKAACGLPKNSSFFRLLTRIEDAEQVEDVRKINSPNRSPKKKASFLKE